MNRGDRAQGAFRSITLERLDRLRESAQVHTLVTLGLVFLGPLLILATLLALGPFGQGVSSLALRLIILADFIYILLIAGLVLGRVLRMVAARRARSQGSRLHLRLSATFAIVALGPTVMVAIFAGLTINVGLEGWFSDRVRQVVGASVSAAEAYETEHRRDLTQDAEWIGGNIDILRFANGFWGDDGEMRLRLNELQGQLQRGLRAAFVIDSDGTIRARGAQSYLFNYDRPTDAEIAAAMTGETVLIRDLPKSEFRALVRLGAFADRLLIVSREVDGQILSLLDETKESARLYAQLETERGRLLFEFGLLYLGFALILVLAAVWLGLWLAERIAAPIGQLAGAVERVGAGDLTTRVEVPQTDDEITTLGQAFNRMTGQLAEQREELLTGHRLTEAQRRQFDSVLSSVTAGVIGLDAEGRIDFLNRSARRLLDLSSDQGAGQSLDQVVPEFAPLFERLREGIADTVQEEIRLTRRGMLESLLVRMASRIGEAEAREGFVVAFDDVTQLVSAQRMAAWGDVARRIAHEIKNPLTPIQLSAERIRRKFTPHLPETEHEALDSYVEVIVRQTNDLRRIVDEFSRFARMPQPETRDEDIVKLVRESVLLQEAGQPGVRFDVALPEGPFVLPLDATMIGQALTNLLKNAGEAIETLQEKGAPQGHQPEIRVRLTPLGEWLELTISDNGIGLPQDRGRLFEPYVTTRERGTGLGLPIVRKIIEEHGGSLMLVDAEIYGGSLSPGAMAVIRLARSSNIRRPKRETGDMK
jgi:two-component system nitrogen regulation sensor histidine kinase NtrY